MTSHSGSPAKSSGSTAAIIKAKAAMIRNQLHKPTPLSSEEILRRRRLSTTTASTRPTDIPGNRIIKVKRSTPGQPLGFILKTVKIAKVDLATGQPTGDYVDPTYVTTSIDFRSFLAYLSALYRPARAVECARLSGHAYRVLIGACNPMPCLIPVFRFIDKADPDGLGYKFGLRAGDHILEIDGTNCQALKHEFVVRLLQNNPGTIQ